ncbi:hypothetical protein PV04_08318 [Phialophora macrospora]|uniref:Uncharacterized protein n=1 Tax=Phialophora macrospora TaxID=1851006 RepID=A0A0D2G1Z7_9EURO|nr:hypothetical protein PV04_08318 [Phialophora macrospora]
MMSTVTRMLPRSCFVVSLSGFARRTKSSRSIGSFSLGRHYHLMLYKDGYKCWALEYCYQSLTFVTIRLILYAVISLSFRTSERWGLRSCRYRFRGLQHQGKASSEDETNTLYTFPNIRPAHE